MMNSQQHSIQETPYSQDIRVQMGERVHTELHQPRQQRYHHMKNVNNCFIAEDKRHPRRWLQGRDFSTPDPHGYHSVIKANNHFIADNRRYQRKMTQDELERGPTAFDPQQFQPLIKAKNRFFVEEGRNYVRSPVQGGEEFGLPRQQSFKPVINANNRLIEENLEYHDKRTNQLYGYSTATEVQVANEERINQHITDKDTTRSPQWEPSQMERLQNECVPTYVENNTDNTENTMRGHGQQVHHNPNAQGQHINSENSTNRDFQERSHIQQDMGNVSINAGTNLEVLERDTTNNVLHHEAGQGNNRQTPVQDNCQRSTTSENSANLNNRPPIHNIHREYNNAECHVMSEGQFFVPQRRHIQGERKSKAVQVDHVEEQYVIKRNMFSGKNPL